MGPHAGPHAAAVAAAATVTSLPPLQPRAATTGGTDLLFPLQVQCVPKYSTLLHEANFFMQRQTNLNIYFEKTGARGKGVVKTLCYKLEGRGLET
jgi:hypothetical protein